jgi:hypothetical protein
VCEVSEHNTHLLAVLLPALYDASAMPSPAVSRGIAYMYCIDVLHVEPCMTCIAAMPYKDVTRCVDTGGRAGEYARDASIVLSVSHTLSADMGQ